MAITLHKTTAVPGTYAANELYCVTSANTDHFELYLTNNAGTAIRRIPTEADINTLIANAIVAAGSAEIVDDITARDALTLTKNTTVVVVDATGDATVTAGAAEYLWDNANSAWIKLSEFESQDIALTWAALTGKPTSTPAAIDTAVTNSHTHANKTELDKIGQLADGNLSYDGAYVKTAFETTAW